jgi:pantoate--beta-alanine ligase
LRIVRSVVEVRAALAPLRGGTVGLVPTMGAYHDGHLALFSTARAECDTVVASLFVNPTQFLEGEDFGSYPRDEARDATLAAESGVDLLYAPAVAEVYPPGFQTHVEVTELSSGLEGADRPGHFRGVATVCLKLFNTIHPDRAYFGQKDAQQVAVVQRLVHDLDVGVEIVVVPTVRDEAGLALSSRNAYLSAEEREVALALGRALAAGAATWRARPGDAAAAAASARTVLAAQPRLAVDYAEIARFDSTTILAGAIRVGRTRLIDNVVLDEGDPPA